jgi:hypothetical protein
MAVERAMAHRGSSLKIAIIQIHSTSGAVSVWSEGQVWDGLDVDQVTKEQADSDPRRVHVSRKSPAESTAGRVGRVKRCSLQSASRKAQFQIIR